MKTTTAIIGAGLLAAAAGANAEVRVGFLTPQSGPAAVVGQDQLDGFKLGLELAGNKLGGQPAVLLAEDDQAKPDIGNQMIKKLIEKDKVNAVVGLGFSNVMMATFKTIADSGIPAISTNAATSQVAGASCVPNFFGIAWQNDGPAEAAGKYVNDQGYKRVVMLAPNYQAGKDMFAGFKRYYKPAVADEIFTQVGQTDYSAEIAQLQSAKPDAVFIFYPGAAGINFVKQFSQAGLNGKLPLFSGFTIDGTSLPALRETANGAITGASWDASLDNPVSKKFVADFKARYKRIPSQFAAAGYDAALLLDVAVKRAGPDATDRKKLAAAIKAAGNSPEFKSVRGKFRWNTNNMPIEDYYVFKVEDATGPNPVRMLGLAMADHADAYASQCPMK